MNVFLRVSEDYSRLRLLVLLVEVAFSSSKKESIKDEDTMIVGQSVYKLIVCL